MSSETSLFKLKQKEILTNRNQEWLKVNSLLVCYLDSGLLHINKVTMNNLKFKLIIAAVITYFKALFLVGSLLFFISCNDNKTKSSNSNSDDSYLTVKIDGVTTLFNDKVSVGRSPELSHVVNGYASDKTRITLGLNLANKETGTFDL